MQPSTVHRFVFLFFFNDSELIPLYVNFSQGWDWTKMKQRIALDTILKWWWHFFLGWCGDVEPTISGLTGPLGLWAVMTNWVELRQTTQFNTNQFNPSLHGLTENLRRNSTCRSASIYAIDAVIGGATCEHLFIIQNWFHASYIKYH